jgi:uncharacterized integral membrane protein
MTEKPPIERPTTPPSQAVSREHRAEPEKRPVSERARETANTGYRVIRWIVLIVLVVIATVFIISNFERVEVDWVFRTSTMPLAIVMLGFLLIGLVIGWLIHWASSRAQRRQQYR